MCSYAPKVSFYLCLRTFFPLSRNKKRALLSTDKGARFLNEARLRL